MNYLPLSAFYPNSRHPVLWSIVPKVNQFPISNKSKLNLSQVHAFTFHSPPCLRLFPDRHLPVVITLVILLNVYVTINHTLSFTGYYFENGQWYFEEINERRLNLVKKGRRKCDVEMVSSENPVKPTEMLTFPNSAWFDHFYGMISAFVIMLCYRFKEIQSNIRKRLHPPARSC